MTAGYDMLGDLGVRIPEAPAAGRGPAEGAGFKIVKPKRKGGYTGTATRQPPHAAAPTTRTVTISRAEPSGRGRDTARGQDAHPTAGSPHRSMTPTRVGDLSPRTHPPATEVYSEDGKTIFRVRARGKFEEFEVYDSEVPCINACNEMIAKEKLAGQSVQRDREARLVEQAIQRDREEERREHEQKREKMERTRRDLEDFAQRKREHDRRQAAADAAAAQRALASEKAAYQQAVDEKIAALNRKAEAAETWRCELNRSVDEKRASGARSEHDRHRPDISSGFMANMGAEVPKEVVRQRGEEIRKQWAAQEEYRKESDRADRVRDSRLQDSARKESEQQKMEKVREFEEKRERQRRMLEESKAMIAEKTERSAAMTGYEVMRDRQRIEREREESQRATEGEKEASRRKADAFRQELAQQIMDRALATSSRASREPKPDLNHNGLESVASRKILFRCPVTDQLLPPSAFSMVSRPKTRLMID
ncbi:hypothetical protein DIPPA_21359 [Diplonema papillatum]|nr:hypothetical protein DIPPA_29943 [Diplonema papillatum]KAJ9453845.1 hypothetical protein DIPPA_21359 [Diplonema papillatum]